MDIQRAMVERDNCQMAEPCQVVNLEDFEGYRKAKLEEWLEEQIYLKYKDKDYITLRNPMLRITTKFEALSNEAQWKLFGYLEAATDMAKRPVTLADRFWSLLEKGAREDGLWEDVENYANELLIEEEAYK